MAINFPNNPADGDEYSPPTSPFTYVWTPPIWVIKPSVGGANVTVSDTPPPNPADNDLWFQSSTGRLCLYYNDGDSTQWVEQGPGAGQTAHAWGTVDAAGNLRTNFNVDSATRVEIGVYEMVMSSAAVQDPYPIFITTESDVGNVRVGSAIIVDTVTFRADIRTASGPAADNAFAFLVYT